MASFCGFYSFFLRIVHLAPAGFFFPKKTKLIPRSSPTFFPQDYIGVKSKHAVYVPHTAGRYAQKRFRKAQCPIVERSVPENP